MAANSPFVRLRLIGQMAAWTDSSNDILPVGRKARAILAVVALSAPQRVLRSKLAQLLWDGRAKEQSRGSLRLNVHHLQKALSIVSDEILSVTRYDLAIDPSAIWIDVSEIMSATATDPKSLSLLDGDLLEDMININPAFDRWLTAERIRLRDHARSIAEAAMRAQTNPRASIQAAQRLLSIDRGHEEAWRVLMLSHANLGDRGMAIQTYNRCGTTLSDLFGTGPAPETQRLLAEIRGSGNRTPTLSAAPPSGAVPSSSLDTPPTLQSILANTATSAARNAPTSSRQGVRLGVKPLQLIGATDGEINLAGGLAEEITNALSRFRWISIVSPASLTRVGREYHEETILHHALNLDLLLVSTVQQVGGRQRIAFRLLDLRAGHQVIWARRFDWQAGDTLSRYDEIAPKVAAQVEAEVLLIETKRLRGRPITDADAHDLVLRALPLIRWVDHESFMRAGSCLARAIQVEPDHAAAHAWYAYWQIFLIGQGWVDYNDAVIQKASLLAERAIALDPNDASVLTISGHVRAFLDHRVPEAAALHEKALSLNPNLPMAWALSAVAHAYMGDAGEAEHRNNRYKTLSPLDPASCMFDNFSTLIHLLRRDHESAVAAGRIASGLAPSFTAGLKAYLSALGHHRRSREADIVRKRLLSLEPNFTLDNYIRRSPLRREADKMHLAEGLRLAGVA